MQKNFLNMTIKEKPLEEDMFSLPITQLKPKEITQYSSLPRPRIVQHRIASCHMLPWSTTLRAGRICRMGMRKEKQSPSALPTPSHPTPRASPSLPHIISTGAGEKWKQPPAVISSGHQVWRNTSPVAVPSVSCRGCKEWVREDMGKMKVVWWWESSCREQGMGLDRHINVMFFLATALGHSASPLMRQHLALLYRILLPRRTRQHHAALLHTLPAVQRWWGRQRRHSFEKTWRGVSSNVLVGHRDRDKCQTWTPKPRR